MSNLINGNFETGDLSGWTTRYGRVTVANSNSPFGPKKPKRKIEWGMPKPNAPTPTIVSGNELMSPLQVQSVAPLEGNFSLRINDLEGDYHACAVEQEITLGGLFKPICSWVSFQWGAMFEETNHTEVDRARFGFSIGTRPGNQGNWNIIYAQDFTQPNGGAGWLNVGSNAKPVWYTQGTVQVPLYGKLQSGHQAKFSFTAEDCLQGEHGGVGFVDNVQINEGCSAKTTAPISIGLLPNVFSPNGDGVNDVFGLSGVQNACVIEFEVFNRWGEIIHKVSHMRPAADWPPFVPLWDGTIRTNRNKSGKVLSGFSFRRVTPNDLGSITAFYVLKLSNCTYLDNKPGFITVF
ncbi:gliding motility-associated C-terminal domain-containing protein [Nostoc sp. NIES-2111]